MARKLQVELPELSITLLAETINYTLNDRDKNAKRLTSLTKYLSDQKVEILKSIN